jgi:hypothetical protein
MLDAAADRAGLEVLEATVALALSDLQSAIQLKSILWCLSHRKRTEKLRAPRREFVPASGVREQDS